jgi:TPR repeat protein
LFIIYQGDAEAQSNLGIAYAFGKGVLKDDKQAVYWYKKAADQGDAEAQSTLNILARLLIFLFF